MTVQTNVSDTNSPAGKTDSFRIYIRWLTFRRQCPTCQDAQALDRTPRPFLLKYLLFFIPTRTYYCYKCRHRVIRIG
ncbi:hypothetical protein [Spirosoma panaciterrae]|uniref:hypothetical protein n=1 Tax=Spirosoma panaciterrae TaxID=496058 RepID=UPI0012FC4A21|nr:hypothetical protein [Spirosoma panaciterrae]